MKIVLKKLNDSADALMRLFGNPTDVDSKIKYRASKIVGKIFEELKHLDQQKIDLAKKHGGKPEKNERGQEILRVPENKIGEYEKELEGLMEMEIEITGERMPFECYEASKNISMLDTYKIMDFIMEPKTEAKKK